MLKPRYNRLTNLARALQRPQVAIPSRAFIVPLLKSASPQIIFHRYFSFVPLDSDDGEQKQKNRPSFAIAAAFEGHEDLEEEDGLDQSYVHTPDVKKPCDERVRALTEQFRLGMEKKKVWMQSLVAQNRYAAVVKCVADCYAPLYVAMGLEGKCPLLMVTNDKNRNHHESETEFKPQRFDDMLTKTTEQEALALLVIAKQSLLALTIVEHREKLAEELARRSNAGIGVMVPGSNVMEDRNVLTLGSHLRMFYSWSMSAYAFCGQAYYPKVLEMYKRAQDAGLYVTANMNVQYLSVLIKQRHYDKLFDFYKEVVRENLPTSVYFYRQMVFAVSVAHNIELLDALLDDMRIKGFKLREVDYLRAIRTYDLKYFLKAKHQHKTTQKHNNYRKMHEHEAMLTTPTDSYEMCVKRFREQDDNPERYKELVEAAKSVVAIFDAMVNIDGLAPRHGDLFSRVITACVYAQEYNLVPDLLALHAEYVDEKLHPAGVRMAVNAYLLLEEPAKAWTLIFETDVNLERDRAALISNIFDYMCAKKLGADIISLMRDVDNLKLQGVFTQSLIKKIVPALCRSIDSVKDEELLAIMSQFDSVFRLFTSEHHFGVFLRECCHNRRIAAVKTALEQWIALSDNKRPLSGSVGVKILKAFEDKSDWASMAETFELINFSKEIHTDNCEAIVTLVTQAYDGLGQSERIKQAKQVLDMTKKRPDH